MATLQDSVGISHKLNIFLLYDSAIVLLDMYPEMYVHTKTSFIQNCQSLETTTVPFNRRMNKQTIIYIGSGILFHIVIVFHEKKETLIHILTRGLYRFGTRSELSVVRGSGKGRKWIIA